MSLIVQVNNGGGGNATPAPNDPSGGHPVTATAGVHHVPSSQPTSHPPMQNSLATLVAAAEQQQQKQQQQQQQKLIHTPTTITRITTNLSPHLVQHHPPPLRMVQLHHAPSAQGPQSNGPAGTVVTTVALPQAPTPLRHALPQTPVVTGVRHPQLPRSPIRQHQLPTTPLQRSLVQAQGPNGPARLSPVQQIRNGQQCIMVNPARAGQTHLTSGQTHLSMLPQNPAPGILSGSGLALPQNPTTLVPLPHHRIHHHSLGSAGPTAVTVGLPAGHTGGNTTTTILPPTLLNRHLLSQHHQHQRAQHQQPTAATLQTDNIDG